MGLSRFIGYHLDNGDQDKAVPIATGRTYEACQATAIRRTLGACILTGSIGVQDRTKDVSEETFVAATQHLNMYFMALDQSNRSKGLARSGGGIDEH